MNRYRTLKLPILILVGAVSGLLVAQPAFAQRNDHKRDSDQRYQRNDDRVRQPLPDRNQRKTDPRLQRNDTRQPTYTDRKRLPERDTRTPSRTVRPPSGYVLDQKYRHDRYYPPRGYVAPRLPGPYRVLVHKNVRYYYHSGVWYRRSTTGFVVVLPPIGVAIPVLPPFYTTVWVSGIPYYYANGIYYVWYPYERAYVVTSPPPESAISDKPEEPEKLFIYPKKGQSEEQQATDRYQCHSWAEKQTGFDPSRAGGNVPADEYFDKRQDYNRAMKACLEARGYSVQ